MLARQERFLRDYPATLNVRESCRRLHYHYTVIYQWIRGDAEFASRFRLVELHALQDVRGALFQRAKEFSDTAAIFLLRRRDPDFADPPKTLRPGDDLPPFTPSLGQRTTVTELRQTTVEGPALTSTGALSDGELAMLKQLLIKAGGKMPAQLEAPVIDVAPVEASNVGGGK